MIRVQSFLGNPILVPNPQSQWDNLATFNGSVLKSDQTYFMVYRAISQKDNLSTIGLAQSNDKINFTSRRQIIKPEYDWEKYGCEDPRLTKIGDTYYIFYTAISRSPPDASSIKVAVAKTRDFITFEKHLVTPFNAKAMVMFPQKIGNQYIALLTVNTDLPPARIALAKFDQESDIWSPDYWHRFYSQLPQHELVLRRLSTDQTEIGSVPVETPDGWLLIYSHIQNYFSGSQRLFGIEALLLDKSDPNRVLGRTLEPIMTPQEDFELQGQVPNIVFPSGLLLENEQVYMYYGAADTTTALATCSYSDLLSELKKNQSPPRLRRSGLNPIITPRPDHPWESRATFNPAAIYLNNEIYIVYRALSDDYTSTFGLAKSLDGHTIGYRDPKPIYVPTQEFEMKKKGQGLSGCEDPRLTRMGNKIYLCYTAYDGLNPPRIALSSISVLDFINHRWNWKKPVIISNFYEDNKDGCLFPEKINNQYVFLHRSGGKGIMIDYVDNIDFDNNEYLDSDICLVPGHNLWENLKMGIAAPPIKTPRGWLVLHHAVSRENVYRVGAILFDLENPSKIIGRSLFPLMEPEENYEKFGEVNNVVFPCGAIVRDNQIFVYYGAADKVIGVATGNLSQILDSLI